LIDHILWACPDLNIAAKTFHNLSGVKPAFGGAHAKGGTWNALVALGSGKYLEIIAPNPSQPEADAWRDHFMTLEKPKLFTFCVAPDGGVGDLPARMAAAGLTGSGPIADGRQRPDGTMLTWNLYFPDPVDDLPVPFFIEWTSPEHPSYSSPTGCSLEQLTVIHPAAGRLREIYRLLAVDVMVVSGPEAAIIADLRTPAGPVRLT